MSSAQVHAGEVYVRPALAWGMLREMSRATDPRRRTS